MISLTFILCRPEVVLRTVFILIYNYLSLSE
nr:MAG TPA: hypothetical protein [Caudoviricetes sp.]